MERQKKGKHKVTLPIISSAPADPKLPSHIFLSRAQGKEAYVVKYNFEYNQGKFRDKLQYRFPLQKNSDLDDPAMAKEAVDFDKACVTSPQPIQIV